MAKNNRILICASEYYPKGSGIANVVYNVEQELKKNNFKVDVCSPTGNIPCGSIKLIQKAGGLGLIYFWWKAKKIIKAKQKNYSLVWIHNPLIFSYPKTVKTVVTTHTTYHEMFEYIKKQKIWKLYPYYALMIAYEKMCYRSLSKRKFTVTGNKTIDELSYLNIRKNITLVPNGAVTISKFSSKTRADARAKIAKKHSIKSNQKLFLYAGRLDYQKNIFKMVDTLTELRKSEPNITLIMAGTGNLDREFSKYLEDKKIKNVILTGQLPYNVLKEYYLGCDYFIMASFYEGFPLALTEATANGLIPLLSEIPVFRDFLGDIKMGTLADFENPKKAANTISKYMKKYNKNDHEKIIDVMNRKYSWKNIAVRYAKIFSNEINAKK